MRTRDGLPFIFVALAALSACSSSEKVSEVELDGAVSDVTTSETSSDGGTTPVDAATVDSGVVDTGAMPDSATFDGATSDGDQRDVGGTFACGMTTCSKSLQYCRTQTGPGTCPNIDAGICPAGCPGCPALAVSCDTLPMKCWSTPSCSCILVEVCGSATAGTCTEKDGGFSAGCHGI